MKTFVAFVSAAVVILSFGSVADAAAKKKSGMTTEQCEALALQRGMMRGPRGQSAARAKFIRDCQSGKQK